VTACVNTLTCSAFVTLDSTGLNSYHAVVSASPVDGANPRAYAGPISITNLADPALLTSAQVATLASRLIQQEGSELGACLALGAEVPTHAQQSSVPDVTLICNSQGLTAALNFMVGLMGTGSAIQAVEALVAANEDPQRPTPHPDCDQVDFNGNCLDEGAPPAVAPDPQPDPNGAGVRPPANCMDSSTASSLEAAMPEQNHHVATQYGSWAAAFAPILARYGLDLQSSINLVLIPHLGPHPREYHEWVYENLLEADQVADGDVPTFVGLFQQWIVNVIVDDPTIVRLAYWKCYR
jgi:hypothetical protein